MAATAQPSVKKVLWLDPAFQAGRPTTQSLFQALPFLLEKGWEMELWCLAHDPLDARIQVRLLPRAPWMRVLEPLWFWFLAGCRLAWLRWRGDKWDIVHITGPDIPGADVMSLHFHNLTWFRLQMQEPALAWKDRLKVLHTLIGLVQESLALRSSRWRVLLPVSEGLAERVRPQFSGNKSVQVLPNLLDEKRFHPSVRPLHRATMRAQLQAGEEDYLFIFVSTGHFHRKGLWPAIRAVQACREIARSQCGLNLRFLVVGAGERAQKTLLPLLDQTAPGWRDWLQLIPPTQEVERWYAAADAFLFPSRYETFSLVALEASACGLPLLITQYDGHEMYLQDGVNGWLLPWDEVNMQKCISQFLLTGRHTIRPGPAYSINASGYADRLDETYRSILNHRAA